MDQHRQWLSLCDPDPIRWIEKHFYIPETKDAIKLEPYQRAVVQEALRRDDQGDFIYSLILYSDLKKSAKSSIAAAVSLYLAWQYEWETVRIVANDLKQADSRTFFYIERAIRLNRALSALGKVKLYHIGLPNNTSISAIPVDPKGEAGGGDLITCFTELWAAKNEAAQRLWSETTLSPLKFGKSLRWAESYAGFTGGSPILEQLYNVGVNQGRLVDVGISGLELYANDSARMLTLWNTIPRCPWHTDEYYRQEEAILTPSEFARIHRNQWSETQDAFVPAAWWDACKVEALPELRPNQGTVLGLDGALRDDCFALVLVSKDGEYVDVREVLVWYPPLGGVIDFAAVEVEIRRLIGQYNIECIVYDEMHVPYLVQRLDDLAFWKKFDQGKPRAVADKQLYDMIRERRIRHRGETTLAKHVTEANRKPEDDSKLRIIKRNEKAKIDAAVSLSMACWQILEWNM